MKIDEKVNNKNIETFKRYKTSYCGKNMYTCVCCGKKTCICDSTSIRGAYLICNQCAEDKFNGWRNCREWQAEMFIKARLDNE